ncbi:MAG: DUF4062 domain-containing protein [Prevotella sp.]|nr:DUF4062 domain-containing protein [Prevotella sp.]
MIEDRNIRIFLSSTFADMQEERNYLVKKTLPALYAECKKRNVDVSVVDLRWGITEEESKTGKVIEICLDEIERTRPFFIGIVGGRYGWIPNESEFIINEHLLLKYPWLKKDISDGLSITELEMQYGALKNSENVKSFFYLRELESVSREFKEKEGTVEFGRLIKLRSSIESAANKGKCQLTPYKTTRSLGDAVYKQLLNLVEELYPIKEDNQWAIIDQKQRAIIARLSKTYYKRNDIFFEDSSKRFPNEIDTDTDNCILLYGERGFGKTSILSVEIGDEINKIPVYHAIIDDEINSIEKLYRLLLYQISQSIVDFKCPEIFEKDKMIDLNKILSNKMLHPYSFYWVIDGLERLASSEDLSMNWLNSLPNNISLILSTSEISIISKIRSIWKDRNPKLCIIPSLNASSIMSITSSYLKNLSKVLTMQQRSHICAHPLLVYPRLLVLFLNEIATFGVYEMLNHYIDKFIATDNLDDFLMVFLNRLEEDFSRERIHDVFSLLCLSNIGMTEQQLRDYLDIPPIDFCSIMNAIDPIVIRENRYLHIATEEIKNSIYHQICLLNRYKENTLRKYIIECRTRESNILIEPRNYPVWDRVVIRMLNGHWMFANNNDEYFRINSEIRHQLALTGQKKKLHAISKNMGIVLLDPFTFSVLKEYEDGLYGLLSIWALPIIYKYHRDLLSTYLTITKTNTSQNQQELFKNKLKCLFLFPKCRKFILNELQGNDAPNEDFEDQWTKENYMQINPINLTMIANQILNSTSYNKKQINSMLQKAASIVADNNLKMEEEVTYANFCLICCCCCMRLNNISEAIRYYSVQETCNGGYLGNRTPILRFMLSFKSEDFATCLRIIEEFGDVNDIETIFNKTRCNIMLMDAKGQDPDNIIAYIKSVSKTIDYNEERLSLFMALGKWLYMWEIRQYAKESFLIVLNDCSVDTDKKIDCYINLANCCNDSSESINYLGKRIELAKSKYGEKWDDGLLECYIDYLRKLRKTSPQTVCDEIDNIIATYDDLTGKAKSSLYHLKAGCYGDMYDKTNDEEIYSKGLILLNKALEYTSAQTDDYYAIIGSRVTYLLRKKESPIHLELLKQDQIIMENGINLSSEDIRDEMRNSLLELYIDTEQMNEACKFYDSCPNPEIFSAWQRQKINEYHSNNTELVSMAKEKIQRIKTWMKEGEIVEAIQWIANEKKNGYDFELVKHILQNWIKERKDVAFNKCVLNTFDIMTNKGLAIPDTFYREYLFEPNMASVILQETNASWSLENTNNKKTFPNDGDVISFLEENRKKNT